MQCINQVSEKTKCVLVNSLSIGLNTKQDCLKNFQKIHSYRVNIRVQKQDAKYIRTTTLKHLQEYNKEKFSELCCLLLNINCGNYPKYEKHIISHLTKQIRNI